jgi:tRNA threonylcarbamoyladenosine biosynthesis protein TsaB
MRIAGLNLMVPMSEPVFLSFETATRQGSVAVLRGREVLSAWRGADVAASHSVHLLPEIEENLRRAQVSLGDLSFLGVAVGPGSFTGLRVGLATAQGLADTLALPLVGVSTLEALACAAGPSEGTVALLPAGRSEVFAQMFAVSEEACAVPLNTLAHLRPAQLCGQMQEFNELLWAGDGAGFLHAEVVREFAAERGLRWRIAPDTGPLALGVGQIALRQWAAGATTDSLTRALYVREADIK